MWNFYFCVVDKDTSVILRNLRNLRFSKFNIWVSEEILNNNDDNDEVGYLRYFRDKKVINYSNLDKSLCYFKWNISEQKVYPIYDGDGLCHLLSRVIQQNSKFICIDSSHHSRNKFVLFYDAIHKLDYPKGFINVPVFTNWDELYSFLEKNGAFDFSLNNSSVFKKLQGSFNVQGASVHEELATGNLWYLDMLHKTHYEVFDRNYKHLGEADLNGSLDKNKRDFSRSLKW